MFIVLVTSGKNESVESVQVRLHYSKTEAEKFCLEMRSGKVKYWTKAEIVDDGEEVELTKPED